MSCWHSIRLPLSQNTYGNSTIETASIQENLHPSLRQGNGAMLCRNCLGALEYAFSRRRGRRYTAEEGPAVETAIVAVCRCPEDGSYSTVYESDIVRNKQYCLCDIRSVLENKADYCLASPRTRSYWRSWFCKVWASVVEKIHRSFLYNQDKIGQRKIIPKSGRRMSLTGSSGLPQNRTYRSVYGSSSVYALSGI